MRPDLRPTSAASEVPQAFAMELATARDNSCPSHYGYVVGLRDVSILAHILVFLPPAPEYRKWISRQGETILSGLL